MQIQHKKTISKKKIALILGGLLLIAAIVAGAWYYYRVYTPQQNKEHFGSETTKPTTDQPKSSSTQNSTSPNLSNPKDTDNSDGDTPVSQPAATVQPAKPIGVFVSNHSPNLSGSPAPNTMNSTCLTTIGATCTIEFKQGSTVKRLEVKQTDSNGNVTWNWKLQDIGLTEGIWTITAVARNGSLTANANDPANLEVGP